MTAHVIRTAVPADAAWVADIAAAAYAPYLSRMERPPAPMTEDYQKRIAAGQVYVLTAPEAPEKPLGFVVLIEEPDGLLLDNVAVLPDRQGKGYGRALILFAEERARRLGCPAVVLYTNEVMLENIRLYHALGYRETHRGVADGLRRVFMRKEPIEGYGADRPKQKNRSPLGAGIGIRKKSKGSGSGGCRHNATCKDAQGEGPFKRMDQGRPDRLPFDIPSMPQSWNNRKRYFPDNVKFNQLVWGNFFFESVD